MGRRNRDVGNHMVGFHNIQPHLAARWRTVLDLNFKDNVLTSSGSAFTGALTENAGSLTSLDGIQYHVRFPNNANQTATVTADTGIVVDFSGTGSAQSRIEFKIKDYLPRYTDGGRPRIRVTGVVSGLVTSHNNDYIGVGVVGMWNNSANPNGPGVYQKYDTNDSSGPVFKYLGGAIKAFGGAASDIYAISGVAADAAGSDNGVLQVEERGQGIWYLRGNDNTTAPLTGISSHTYRGFVNSPTALRNGAQADRDYYSADTSVSWDGPYLMLITRHGSNGSQAVTWERAIVEAYY